MNPKSVYLHFKPLLVICAVFGSFCALPIAAKHSNLLEFNYFSFPVILFLVQKVSLLWTFLMGAITNVQSADSIDLIHHFVFQLIEIVRATWVFLGSKHVIEALRKTDQLRSQLGISPCNRGVKCTNPVVFSWLLVFLFILLHGSVFILYPYFVPIKGSILSTLQYWILFICSPLRGSMIYSCIYYSCALVAHDTVRMWQRYIKYKYHSDVFLSEFCQFISTQHDLFKTVNELLRKYIFILLSYRAIFIVGSIFFFSEIKTAVYASLILLILWSAFLGLLILSMSLAAEQFEKLQNEVFLLPIVPLSRRETYTVRVSLAQLGDKHGVFTAGSFVEVKPSLFLTFTALGIDFFIMLAQNLEVLREMVGVTLEP